MCVSCSVDHKVLIVLHVCCFYCWSTLVYVYNDVCQMTQLGQVIIISFEGNSIVH